MTWLKKDHNNIPTKIGMKNCREQEPIAHLTARLCDLLGVGLEADLEDDTD